ncbi:MAG: flagellar M-ring protein FliF [Geobacteraceae bacterium]|nr:flagellar M-ring protein FliF [Geobacteraceae bacterium]
MPEALKKIVEPFLALSTSKRWVVGGVVGLSVLLFASLILVANKTDYRPLFANLTGEDAGEIVKKLKEQKIPYRIEGDGKAILVPADKVYDLRLSLASDGLPQGGGIGFEIFDRKNFGVTEFVQKLNYQRALQGELSRTISQLAGVEQARVHLAIPEKSLFKEEEKQPTASVVLKMKSARALRESEVQGIVHLVSSSIEGMDPEKVTVLDSRGKILSRTGSSDPTGKMSSAMLEMQHSYEKTVEERLQGLLDKAVGAGKSVAKVNAVFDFKQVEKYEERYDPEATAVRSEQRTEEKNGSASSAAGIPGVQSNTGRTTAPAPSAPPIQGSKSDETMNYEVSRSTARIIEPVGTLSKISVAVLVDGKTEGTPGATGAAKPKYVPRSPDELQKIESLVKSAVGFNGERGDQVTVANIPFQDASQMEEGGSGGWWNAPIFLSLLKNGLIAFGFLALLLLVVRPLIAVLRSSKRQQDEGFVPLEQSEEQLVSQQKLALAMHTQTQMDLIEKVKQDPYQAAQIIQNWLQQRD